MTKQTLPQDMEKELAVEARVLGSYLIGERIDERAVALYVKAHRTIPFVLDEKDQRLLNLLLKHPFLLGSVDGGLALVKRRSHLRKKLYYLLAILETIPRYSKKFLSQKRPFWAAVLNLAFFGIRGVMRALTGCMLYILI
ncbi:MAG: hypothetical protein HXY38_10000 [Chloroflexi bacterium]|nr:hypothetical protein [Chloroflexota bacterium]